jgi:carboxyl-terminal processing protease
MKNILLSILFFFNVNKSLPAEDVQGVVLNDKLSVEKKLEDLELFNKVFYLVETQYYRNVNSSQLIEGAIKGLLETLDPHSSFLNPEIFKKIKNETEGEFGGLGIEVTARKGKLIIVTVIEGSPAAKSKIFPKDVIVSINDENLDNKSIEESMNLLKGKIKSKVKLGIKRQSEAKTLYFDLTRDIVKITPVKFELLNETYAYLKLSQFQRLSGQYIEKAMIEMENKLGKEKKISGIVLDLRSNPGGLLDEAVEVASLFLDSGVVVMTEARDVNNKDIRYVKKSSKKFLEYPMVVLINSSSASAAEIVAGALQDHKRALIVGEKSFGKGSVQTIASLGKSNEYGLKLTVAQYMTPNKRKIQALGIDPDVVIPRIPSHIFKTALMRENESIREEDLDNHLTAKIETQDQKNIRLKYEKERKKEKKSSTKNSNKDEEDLLWDIDDNLGPKDDFQVLQSINLLKAHYQLQNLQK